MAPDAIPEGKVSQHSLMDYYPVAHDRRVSYTTPGSGSISIILQYFHDENAKVFAQFKQSSSSSSHVSVVQITQDKISDLYYSQDIPYRTNLMGWNDYEERIILQSPLQVGNRWESTGLEFEITAVDEPRLVGSAERTVLDVTVSGDDETIRFSYAVGIGLVSSDVVNEDGSLTNIQSIEQIEEDVRDSYETAFYFPSQDQKNHIVTKSLEFQTNDAVKNKLTEAYKQLAEDNGFITVLGEEVQIQYVFREDDLVRLDLNDAFIDFVNESPEVENARIQNLVNTLCKYYRGTEGVILTINDQRYESANRKIEPDEILKPAY